MTRSEEFFPSCVISWSVMPSTRYPDPSLGPGYGTANGNGMKDPVCWYPALGPLPEQHKGRPSNDKENNAEMSSHA